MRSNLGSDEAVRMPRDGFRCSADWGGNERQFHADACQPRGTWLVVRHRIYLMKKLLALFCFSISTLALPAAEATGWTTDYKAALEQAKADDRRVFLFFTGSDWCSWCKRLNREILSTPEFQKFAGEKLVLVELDFPKSKAQPAPVKEQNAKLAQQFKIEGYPTVIVLDSSGKKVGELGYQEGGAVPFIKAISKM